jgi:hypothetical protein
MDKSIYTFPPHNPFGIHFGIVKTLSGTYVCPGWYPVPDGTTRDQIRFDMTAVIEKPKEVVLESEIKRWEVPGSKPGVLYTILRGLEDDFTCSCPAFSFRRGDCKHIKGIKDSLK